MCNTNQAHLKYKRGCAVRIRHIFSTSEDVQYESGTSSVQARMCNTIRHIFSTNEDVQYESGTSSVQARTCSTNQAHLQYKRGRAIRIRHIFSTREDVQYESGNLRYKRGCAIRIRYIFSTREDVQYESGTSSLQARICNTNQAHLQYKRGCIINTNEDIDVQYEHGISSKFWYRGALLKDTFQGMNHKSYQYIK